MSFRDNLQHLRATRNMTQEQLAMLLGVSRQSVTKWEAEKSYPEMDKLLKICQIFECSLDDLVTGDLTSTPINPTAAPQIPSGPPTDIFGYDEHMRGFALRIATGVALILAGLAACAWVDESFYILEGPRNGLSFMIFAIGIVAGLAFLIPAGMEHAAFTREHPWIEDFYTAEKKAEARRALSISVIVGVGLILVGMCFPVFLEDTAGEDAIGGPMFLTLIAVAVWCFIYGGIMGSRVNIAERNKDALDDLEVEDIMNAQITEERRTMLLKSKQSRKRKLTGTVCAIIMLISTAIALTWLFTSPLVSGDAVTREAALEAAETIPFWIPWPIGGICCGIASIAIEGFVKDDE